MTAVGLYLGGLGLVACAPASQDPSPPAAEPASTQPAGLADVPGPGPAGPSGRTLTVGPGGAFPTIGSAIAAATAGDSVVIATGTYDETLNVNKKGAPNRDIVIRAAPGASVTVKGSVKVNGAAFVDWIGIAVDGSSSYGISGADVHDVTFQSCQVSNARDGGLDIFNGSNVVVDGCDIHGNNSKGANSQGEALSIAQTRGTDLRNNTVHDNGKEGIDTKDSTTAGRVHDNTVWNNRGPNIYVDSAQGITVDSNRVYGATNPDKPNIMVGVESYALKQLADNVTIRDNAIFNGAGSGVGFWKEDGGTITNVTVTDNHIWGNKGRPINGSPDSGGGVAGNIEAPPAANPPGRPTP